MALYVALIAMFFSAVLVWCYAVIVALRVCRIARQRFAILVGSGTPQCLVVSGQKSRRRK